MTRVLGFVVALVVIAGAAHAEEDRSAYAKATALLTEKLNAVIAERVDLPPIAPPAKRDDEADVRAESPTHAKR